MRLLRRIFNHYAEKKAHEISMALGVFTYRVKKLEGGRGYIALGTDIVGHPDLKMATLAIWTAIPNQPGYSYDRPELRFSAKNKPETPACAPGIYFRSSLSNVKFNILCAEAQKYATLLFEATGGTGE